MRIREIEDIIKTTCVTPSGNYYDNPIGYLREKNIIIYGAGAFGREILSYLEESKVNVTAFFDINAKSIQQINSIPVFPPEHLFDRKLQDEIVILLSIVLSDPVRTEIISYLNILGYHNIIDAQTIRAMKVPYNSVLSEPECSQISLEKEGILNAFSLLNDLHSQDIYINFLKSHFSRNYENALESPDTVQYFSPKIKYELKFYRFVDCGAYRGDTFESLLSYVDIKAYAGFEPGIVSFQKLSNTVDTIGSDLPCFLYPCAVGERTTIVSFSDIPGSGAVNEAGEEVIPMVRLDDVLKNFRPTMIKMDIEGQEYNALLGAQKMITKYKPDLAICVYHYISDLWRIPNLIHSWNLGYQFYLRAHSSATMETVMYAIVRDEDSLDASA